jgi:5,10-methenyltetrahydrofolate synthetase
VPVPIEDETHPSVSPQVLVVPCVGFDTQGYRLGYGGGYYDRTLARDAPGRRPVLALGVAWSDARVLEFEPMPTDVPLDGVVTPQETVTSPR